MAKPTAEVSWIVVAVAGWLLIVGSDSLSRGYWSAWIMLSLGTAAIAHEFAQWKLMRDSHDKTMRWIRDIADVYFVGVCFLTLLISV